MRQVRVVLDLASLGELAGRIALAFADHRGIEMNDDDDMVVAQATLDALHFMFDRAEFARSVLSDLDDMADDIAIAKEIRERDASDTRERITLDELRSEFDM